MSERRPLSLNERANRFLLDLSRSRPSKPPSAPEHEPQTSKVRIEGRRRLCKLSEPDDEPFDVEVIDESLFDSPPPRTTYAKELGDGEQIRDILSDLTAKLECLSVERPRKAAEVEVQEEFGSAKSSLSPGEDGKVKRREEGLEEEEDKEVESVVPGDAGEVLESCGYAVVDVSDDWKAKRREEDLEEEEETEVDAVPGDAGEVLESCGYAVVDVSDDGKVKRREEDLEEEEEKEVESAGGADEVLESCGYAVVDVSDDEESDARIKEEQIEMKGSGCCKGLVYRLPAHITKILYPHQREGLSWLWSLHCGMTGGILGDDMGLGKTMQMSSYLAGLFHSRLIKRALIVAPKTLLPHWIKELTVVGLSRKIKDYYATNAKLRNFDLEHVLKAGGILLTTYDIVRNNFKWIRGDFWSGNDDAEDEIRWDYVILDEGHIIKNPSTQRAKSLLEIPSSHRIIISGTPIQNNLKELWALFNFCCPTILGDKKEFKERYEHKILRGNDKNASNREKYVGSSVARELRERIKPYFLRRLKSEVFSQNENKNDAQLSRKTELIIWLRLSQSQRKLYEAFLNSELVHLSINGSPLAALTILKKICDHPLLLTKRAAEEVLDGMDAMLNKEDIGMAEDMARSLATMTDLGEDCLLNKSSCKISFVLSLLHNLISDGHHVLIFSQTRKMLNFIQEMLASEGFNFLRIDGTTKMVDRERIVDDFQSGIAPILLLTSRVGGLGLTLTKADRVIVIDPAWNPSMDNQSVDRAYRIGQKKDVVVYRLMTCGTIEEKIYKMQVFKGGLFKIATEQKEQTRYFSQRDLKELFSLPEEGFDVSVTQQQLQEEHDQHHDMDDCLVQHIRFLEQQGIAGVSHHSLLFTKTDVVPVDEGGEEQQSWKGKPIMRNWPSTSASECPTVAEEYAVNPRLVKTRLRMPNRGESSSSEIENRQIEIQNTLTRLSGTLSNNAVISKLPDKGEKIIKRIAELNRELEEIRESAKEQKASTRVEVFEIDDVADELGKGFTSLCI